MMKCFIATKLLTIWLMKCDDAKRAFCLIMLQFIAPHFLAILLMKRECAKRVYRLIMMPLRQVNN